MEQAGALWAVVNNQRYDDRRATELAEQIAYAQGIPTEQGFVRHVSDVFRDPDADPAAVDALRSPVLARRTLTALETTIRFIDEDLRTNDRRPQGDPLRRGPDWARGTRRRMHLYGLERQRLRELVLAEEEAAGRKPNQPNPRRRAEHLLAQLVMTKGAVTRGDFYRLLEQEQETDARRKRERRAELKAQQRAAKQAGQQGGRGRGGPVPRTRPLT